MPRDPVEVSIKEQFLLDRHGNEYASVVGEELAGVPVRRRDHHLGLMTGEHARRLPGGGSQGLVGRLSNLLGLRPRKREQQTALDRLRYSDSVSLGNSPTVPNIEVLARKAGFRALLNLNTDGERGQILCPNGEAT
jgi:hypothetical protein